MARKHYEAALRIDPINTGVHTINMLGVLLADRFQEYGAAREHYERALRINPNHAEARNNLAQLLAIYILIPSFMSMVLLACTTRQPFALTLPNHAAAGLVAG